MHKAKLLPVAILGGAAFLTTSASAQIYTQVNAKTVSNIVGWTVSADNPLDTTADADGNRYVAGDAVQGGKHVAYVTKIDATGAKVWHYVVPNASATMSATAVSQDGAGRVYVAVTNSSQSWVVALDANNANLKWQSTKFAGIIADIASDVRGVSVAGSKNLSAFVGRYKRVNGSADGSASFGLGAFNTIVLNANGATFAAGLSHGSKDQAIVAYWNLDGKSTSYTVSSSDISESVIKEIALDPLTQTAVATGSARTAGIPHALRTSLHVDVSGTTATPTGHFYVNTLPSYGGSIAANQFGIFAADALVSATGKLSGSITQQSVNATFGLNSGWSDQFDEPTGNLLVSDVTFDSHGNPIVTALSDESYGTAPNDFAGYTQFIWSAEGDRYDRVLLGSKTQRGIPVNNLALPNDLASNIGEIGLVYGPIKGGRAGQFLVREDGGPTDSYEGTEDEILEVKAADGLLINDGNEFDFSPLSAKLVPGSESAGIADVQVNAQGSFKVTPTHNFNGDAEFQYKKKRGNTVYDTITVHLHFAPANDAPTAVNDEYTVASGSDTTVLNVLDNDIDIDGDNLIIIDKTTNANAFITVTTDKKGINFKPKANYTGTITFKYTIKDPRGETSVATVKVHVN